MIQLGDIKIIDGYAIPTTDCVIGGSPCQDLSIAGSRAGLSGERSGLFMEQIRIVKEMREADAKIRGRVDYIRPNWMLWENVPGALSSGTPKGEDFRIILEEICRIKDPAISIPRPQKWEPAGCIMGKDYSVAWRIHDAQYWGTPQRRRRIALIADFGGCHAAELLFEEVLFQSESMCRDSSQSGKAREADSSNNKSNFAINSAYCLNNAIAYSIDLRNQLINKEISGTIQANDSYGLMICDYQGRPDVIRHFTPKELERLQGFPDDWTNIPGASDTQRRKALGNSICLPYWRNLIERISSSINSEHPTMGSLFDGIGGFPLIWEEINGKGTALWASEIDKFCIAVTKARIG